MDITKILFIDVETVGTAENYEDMPERLQKLWDHKSKFVRRGDLEHLEPESLFPLKAAIFAEFGRIVCISVGLITGQSDAHEVRITSFANEDEAKLLNDFAQMMDQYYYDIRKHYLCGHNIREFDIPYLCRRMVVHKIKLPALLNIHGKKPWELEYLLDTMQLWKFGDYKHYTSLDLLAAIFNIPSPKSDMDGSQVHHVFYVDKDLESIRQYCEKDVITTIQVFLHMKAKPAIPDSRIINI